MAKEISKQTLHVFEQIKQTDEKGNEFWSARQLARVLNYTDFRNFQSVINKAKESCRNSGQQVEQHIVDFNEVLIAGQGAKQVYPSVKL
jgi:DNA-damage-inducible protein D